MTGFASAAGRGPLVALSLPRHRHQLLYWHWSTPGRIRSHAAAVVTLACCLAALTAVLAGQLHEEFGAIGQTDAPEADATTGLYFALNDMDAQVANVLLVGGEPALAVTKAKNLAIYATDRSTASRDLGRATAAEADNAAAQRELSLVLDRIGQYEALAADAQLAA